MSRRSGLIVAQTLLGVGLLIAWLWIIDIESVGHLLSQTKWPLVALAAAIGVLSGVLRTYRWRMILTPIARIRFVDIWLISSASSLINFVIPIRSGEIARSLFLKHRDKVPISASLPTVAVDRSFDLLAVVVIGAAGALAGLRLASSLSLVLLLGAGLFSVFAVSVLLAIVWRERFLSLAERTIPRIVGENIGVRILTLLEGIIVGFTTVGSQPGKLLPILILSFFGSSSGCNSILPHFDERGCDDLASCCYYRIRALCGYLHSAWSSRVCWQYGSLRIVNFHRIGCGSNRGS